MRKSLFLPAFITAGLCLLLACQSGQKKEGSYNLRFKTFQNIRVGVLPGVGGRVIYFSLVGLPNVFKEDTALWYENAKMKPSLVSSDSYKAYQGHVVWPAPMDEWWTYQELFPEKKARKDRWPPDPYLEYGVYSIQESEHGILMTGSESPISKIKMKKELISRGSNSLEFVAWAENTSDSMRNFSFWFNTRFPAGARFFVPITNFDSIAYKHGGGPSERSIIPRVKNDFFSFEADSVPKEDIYKKALIHTSARQMAVFSSGQLMLISFERVEKSDLPSGHANIEVFLKRSSIVSEDLLEMEFLSSLRELKPGDSTHCSCFWKLVPYYGADEPESQMEFLKFHIGKPVIQAMN